LTRHIIRYYDVTYQTKPRVEQTTFTNKAVT